MICPTSTFVSHDRPKNPKHEVRSSKRSILPWNYTRAFCAINENLLQASRFRCRTESFDELAAIPPFFAVAERLVWRITCVCFLLETGNKKTVLMVHLHIQPNAFCTLRSPAFPRGLNLYIRYKNPAGNPMENKTAANTIPHIYVYHFSE